MFKLNDVDFLFGSHQALGIPDRASKRLFHTSVLRPKGGTKHCEVSQKLLSASACRYFLFWVNSLLVHVNTNDVPGKHLDKDLLSRVQVCFLCCWDLGGASNVFFLDSFEILRQN